MNNLICRLLLEDFCKPKIIYPETTQGAYFAIDYNGMFIDKTCFMLISKHANYLQLTLSSKLFEFAYKRIFSSISLGNHAYQYNKHALVELPIYPQSIDINKEHIDETIYSLYDINEKEQAFIESQ